MPEWGSWRGSNRLSLLLKSIYLAKTSQVRVKPTMFCRFYHGPGSTFSLPEHPLLTDPLDSRNVEVHQTLVSVVDMNSSVSSNVFEYVLLDMTLISTGWPFPNSRGRRRSFCHSGSARSYNCLPLCWTHHDWGGVLRKIWVSWKQGRLGMWERFDRWKLWNH